MKYGEREKWFRELEREGVEVKALKNKPCIIGEDWIFDAWGELSGDRSNGMGMSPTPWSAISRYAECYGIAGDDFEMLCYGIRCLDTALIDYYDKRQERESKAKNQKAKRDAKVQQNKRR